MSDIVERLRHTASKGISGWGDLQIQAANEIQVLRAERNNQADEIERLRAEVAGLQIKADLFDLAVRKGLLSVHSELIVPRNHGTRCSWLEGHAKACDISNNAALAARKGEA